MHWAAPENDAIASQSLVSKEVGEEMINWLDLGQHKSLSVRITTVTSMMWRRWVHSQNKEYHPQSRIPFNYEIYPSSSL